MGADALGPYNSKVDTVYVAGRYSGDSRPLFRSDMYKGKVYIRVAPLGPHGRLDLGEMQSVRVVWLDHHRQVDLLQSYGVTSEEIHMYKVVYTGDAQWPYQVQPRKKYTGRERR